MEIVEAKTAGLTGNPHQVKAVSFMTRNMRRSYISLSNRVNR